MLRKMRTAAFAVAVTLVLGGLALAQYRDSDDYYYNRDNGAQARQYGYQNGYRDGLHKGKHEGRENDPGDFRSREWDSASRGYQSWMGPLGLFQQGYRDGYRAGFRSGYQSVHHRWGDGDGDADDRVYDRGGYGVYDGGGYGDYGSGSYGNNRPWFGGAGYNGAYNFGYQDGSSVAREDIAKGKPYNPNPRGRYDDEDHGYHREYGDKNAYKAQYANGYRAGYESVFGHRRGY